MQKRKLNYNIESRLKLFSPQILVGFEIAHIATLLGFQGKVLVYDSKEGAPLAKERIQQLGVSSKLASLLSLFLPQI